MFGRLVFALCCGNVAASSPQRRAWTRWGKVTALTWSMLRCSSLAKAGLAGHVLIFCLVGESWWWSQGIDQLLDNIRGKVLIDLEDALQYIVPMLFILHVWMQCYGSIGERVAERTGKRPACSAALQVWVHQWAPRVSHSLYLLLCYWMQMVS
jgi:hypothetical protein